MRILGIETSCDETAAAVLEVKGGKFKVLSNKIASSVKLHAKYGGIVPELAARAQMEYIIPVIESALKGVGDIDYIAVTNGPGLITSLRVGVEAAKTLSYTWNKPLIAVNHLEGHIFTSELPGKKIKFPALALIVSGGHTQLVLVKDYLNYKIIGETQDDAVGEAFDKVGKILSLGYPGGPVVSKLAEKGSAGKIEMPRPMINSGDYNFSFSGIKTSVLYKVKKGRVNKADMCASFQQACTDVLVIKAIKAATEYKVKSVIIGGGVAANKSLREELDNKFKKELSKVNIYIPEISLTGDNALMIAVAGYYKIKKKKFSDYKKIKVDPNLKL
jgi:N6-L-threonylcarbamoyladenine synthase